MSRIMTDRSRRRQRRIARRLDKFTFPDDLSRPMLRATNMQHEVADRAVGTSYGGIGLMQAEKGSSHRCFHRCFRPTRNRLHDGVNKMHQLLDQTAKEITLPDDDVEVRILELVTGDE